MQSQEVQDWLVSHNSDYAAVRGRLEAVRNVVLRGRLESAAKVLEKSYVNAVLSIRTDKDRHEKAFVAYYSGGISLKEAALKTVYGGNKKNWLRRTFDSVDWKNVAMAVRAHMERGRHADLLEAITDNLVGVSHRKGSFMLAMSGLYEFMCVDSNVANFAGLEESEDNSLTFKNAREYMDVCDTIRESVVGKNPWVPPFIVQWAIYDAMRGEHSRHMVFFNEVLEK
jgi:hypothetical protein